ncbi:MAG: rRNA pseudouridine synthase [Leptospiraceae bacterium]|nr:rRNA pseudouridine synthase [Leptospiraceae bacterium]MCP5513073.1 rRNA pseudouridine synthase [Leptospiraceae bacterium]
MKKRRLDQVLSRLGIGSRKAIRKIIRKTTIEVNGKRILDTSFPVSTEDEIKIDGEIFPISENYFYMLNKPAGVVTATEDPKDKTVIDLLEERDKRKNVFPVGRLDKNTEGLILLTTDGKLAHFLMSPRKNIYKTYIATVLGKVTESDIQAFSEGIVLDDGYKTLPAILKIFESGNESKVEIQIREGKFHQIKKMFLSLDKKVIYLKRISLYNLNLDPELKLGEYRSLTETEIESLYNDFLDSKG